MALPDCFRASAATVEILLRVRDGYDVRHSGLVAELMKTKLITAIGPSSGSGYALLADGRVALQRSGHNDQPEG